MPHFSNDLLDAAPETLSALRETLHGRQQGKQGGRTVQSVPTKEGRFGVSSGGRPAPVRKRHPSAPAGV